MIGGYDVMFPPLTWRSECNNGVVMFVVVMGTSCRMCSVKKVDSADKAGGSDVVVEFLAAPVNPSDVNTIQGRYPVAPETSVAHGMVPGHEGVARIVHVGPKVTGLSAGDLVVPARAGIGTWRASGVLNQVDVVKVDKKLNVDFAAQMTVNPATALKLIEESGLKKGDVLVQNAANGAVGRSVIQIAKALGIVTVNVVRDRPDAPELIEALKKLGGDIVLTDTDVAKIGVKPYLEGVGEAKVAFDGVGGKLGMQVARLLGRNGELVVYGAMGKQPTVDVPITSLLFKGLTVKGFWMTQWKEQASKEDEKKLYKTLSDLNIQGKLQLPAHTVSVKTSDDLVKAIASTWTGFYSGKVLLSFGK